MIMSSMASSAKYAGSAGVVGWMAVPSHPSNMRARASGISILPPAIGFDLPRRPSTAVGVRLRSRDFSSAGTDDISGDSSREPSRDTGWLAAAGDGVDRPGDAIFGGLPLAEETELSTDGVRSGERVEAAA